MVRKILGLTLLIGLCSTTAFAAVLINGAGATFPYPIYSKWFASAPTHAIRGLLRLARQSGKWNELILILKSWRKVPELYSLALKDWLNIFNIQQELPTTEQVLTIQGLRQTILEDIDQDTLDLLRFTLKPFKIIV